MHRAVLLAAAGLLVAGCGSSGAGGRASSPTAPITGDSVTIKDFAYAPKDLTVGTGTTVTWTMADAGTVHTVTDGADHIDSGDLEQGATFRYTFTRPGRYRYLCTEHRSMTGTVTVR